MVTFVIAGIVGLFALAAVVAVTDALFAGSRRRTAADRRLMWELRRRGAGLGRRRWSVPRRAAGLGSGLGGLS